MKEKRTLPEHNIYGIKIKCQLEPKKERKWRPMKIGKERMFSMP